MSRNGATVELTFTGIPRLDRRLRQIEKRDGRRIGRKAVRRGLSLLQRAIKAAAPRGPKKPNRRGRPIKRSIGQRFSKSKTNAMILALVGINVKVKRDQQAPHGAALTVPSSRGPGDPFVERTTRSQQRAAFAEIDKTVISEINALR